MELDKAVQYQPFYKKKIKSNENILVQDFKANFNEKEVKKKYRMPKT